MSRIELDVDHGLAIIRIDSPATRNALNPVLARELVQVCEQLDSDRDVGAAVVCGAGGTFCSGAERELLSRNGEDPADPERYAELGAIYDAFIRVGNLAVPTVAAVQGAAVGAGVNLLLATDLRIVATDARIMAGFTRIGIHPGGGHFALLARLVGWEAAAAIGVFGEEVSGQRAAELGLAWAAVDAGRVDETARQLASAAARDPQLARRVVTSMRRELTPPGVSWDVAIDFERAAQMWSLRRRHVAAVTQR